MDTRHGNGCSTGATQREGEVEIEMNGVTTPPVSPSRVTFHPSAKIAKAVEEIEEKLGFGAHRSESAVPLTALNADPSVSAPIEDDLGVRDRYLLVYLTFVLHGIGILMPWNMFINAKDVSRQLSSNYQPPLVD
ncbi:unnamed protein product [Cyprideis torosa]|uniref:Uncharacterized protein n=1 Tax=Cyprideis torosa TaxID=163714 RepID=A0A7R8WB68_9CRUS|nr:unnamed protein product [Cyprideis torosa]CAG0891989.1 unnamed protein product [Cyprideis torosa]